MASLYVFNSCMWQQGLLHSRQGRRRPAASTDVHERRAPLQIQQRLDLNKITPWCFAKTEMLGQSTVACMHDTHVFSTWTDSNAQTQQQPQTAITLT
jgi:hypothetical protein